MAGEGQTLADGEPGGRPQIAWLCRAVRFLPSPRSLPLPIISASTALGRSWAVRLAALSRAVSEDDGITLPPSAG